MRPNLLAIEEMWMGEMDSKRIPFYQLIAIEARPASNAPHDQAIDDIVTGFLEAQGTEGEKLDWLRARLAAFLDELAAGDCSQAVANGIAPPNLAPEEQSVHRFGQLGTIVLDVPHPACRPPTS